MGTASGRGHYRSGTGCSPVTGPSPECAAGGGAGVRRLRRGVAPAAARGGRYGAVTAAVRARTARRTPVPRGSRDGPGAVVRGNGGGPGCGDAKRRRGGSPAAYTRGPRGDGGRPGTAGVSPRGGGFGGPEARRRWADGGGAVGLHTGGSPCPSGATGAGKGSPAQDGKDAGPGPARRVRPAGPGAATAPPDRAGTARSPRPEVVSGGGSVVLGHGPVGPQRPSSTSNSPASRMALTAVR
jgi:hypothetical protein